MGALFALRDLGRLALTPTEQADIDSLEFSGSDRLPCTIDRRKETAGARCVRHQGVVLLVARSFRREKTSGTGLIPEVCCFLCSGCGETAIAPFGTCSTAFLRSL